MKTNHPYGSAALLVFLLLLLTACQPMSAPAAPANDVAPPAPTSAYPVTIENCGRTLTFDQAPQRPVAIYQTATEFMLALGLGDQLVAATQFEADPLPSQAEAFAALPELWERPIPREVLISAKPDFVFAGYETYDLSAERGSATIADLEAAGAQVYIISGNCANTANEVTLESVFTDLRNLGQIFGIASEAKAIIAEMQTKLSAIESQIAGRPVPQVAFLDIGEGGTPVWAYANGIYKDIIERAGGKNIFDDQAEQFVEISAEEVASRNPDVFVVVDSPYGAPAAGKLALLYTTFPNAPATQNQRSALILEMNTLPGVRIVDAVVELAHILHPDLAATSSPSLYPVTVESCGEAMTFAQAPQRMVVFENNLLEIALRLGLQDRIVGIWTGSELSVDPTVQAAAAQLTAISTEGWPPPALEPVLGVEPDFVWSGWGYGFSEESGLTPARLLELGINSYATTESCIKAGVGEAVTIESTYTDILTIGRIFGVEAAAQTLVDGMKSRIDAAVAAVGAVERPLRVFYYDSGEAEPFTAGSLGMPSVMMALVGGENIFADVEKDWFTTSWEEVIARDPEVIIVANSAWATAEDNIAFLQSKPELADITAMQNERFGTISYRQSTPGLPNAEAVELLAQALYPEKFK